MGTHPIFESDFDCLTDNEKREKKMAPAKKKGVARKSTHSKSKRIEKSAQPVIKEIDATAMYEIDKIGPIHLQWGKKNTKNEKGKMVKKWYIDKSIKHRLRVKWQEPFEDKHERGDDYKTIWSAEDQKTLLENKSNKQAVETALNSKFIWPWVKKEDEGYEDRVALLKKGGYKEWKPTTKSDGNGSSNKWKIKFAIEPKTDTNTSGNSSDSDTTSTDANEEEEEEDDV